MAYNSCRNRHCPKFQSSAAREWLEARQDDLLPVEYFHLVFTLPAPIAAIAKQNKAVVYGLLFEAASETLKVIAADPRHLGAEIGMTMVLHTWGQTLTYHPHVHVIVPGGGLSPDGGTWIACRPSFFLPMKVLQRLYRRFFLAKLVAAHASGRRFLLHALPDGFQRIRHYGFLANGNRKAKLALIRRLLVMPEACAETVAAPEPAATEALNETAAATDIATPCPCCGGPMRITEILVDSRRRRLRFDSS